MIKQTKDQRHIARLKRQIETLQTSVTVITASRKTWMDEAEKYRKLYGEAQLSHNNEVRRRECDRVDYVNEIARLKGVIENREAVIGRLCIDRQVIR